MVEFGMIEFVNLGIAALVVGMALLAFLGCIQPAMEAAFFQ